MGLMAAGKKIETQKPQPMRKAGVANNPLLLYMLARYVEPIAREEQKALTRSEVFRIFVDETIRGKLRTSREDLPIHFAARDYRLLLQEIAYLASWPKHAPKCPVRLVREKMPESILKDLNFQDVRTAFVLHFFEPGDASASEFEFQPEGFRQYLLAEWCARAQIEAVLDEDPPAHPLSRTRSEAVNALAQVPLLGDELTFLNEIYEDLGRLTREGETASERLHRFGMTLAGNSRASELVPRLYQRVRREAEAPPSYDWRDERAGLPQDQQVPAGLDKFRLLVNYWEQSCVATFGLYRGLAETGVVFERDARALHRFFFAAESLRFTTKSLNLSRLNLTGLELVGVNFSRADLCNVDLTGANLAAAWLGATGLKGANLSRADLSAAYMAHVDLTDANLVAADLRWAGLNDARLENADLAIAKLAFANLRDANLARANLTGANLSQTNLTGAKLIEANIDGADLTGSIVSGDQLAVTLGRPARLPDGSRPG